MIEELDSLTTDDYLDILDHPTRSRLEELYPPFAEAVFNTYFYMYKEYGLRMRCTEGVRSYERQRELYEQGRSKPGKIITNAKEGQSLHNFGLAADSCFVGNDPYLTRTFNGSHMWYKFGSMAKLNGLTWGKDIPGLDDMVHVEMVHGLSLGELQYLHAQGGAKLLYKELDSLVIKEEEISQ